jgi:hypothetical protein
MFMQDLNLKNMVNALDQEHRCHRCGKKQYLIKHNMEIEKVIITEFPTFDCQNQLKGCEYTLPTLLILRLERLIQDKKITGSIDFCSIVQLDDLPDNYFDKMKGI